MLDRVWDWCARSADVVPKNGLGQPTKQRSLQEHHVFKWNRMMVLPFPDAQHQKASPENVLEPCVQGQNVRHDQRACFVLSMFMRAAEHNSVMCSCPQNLSLGTMV